MDKTSCSICNALLDDFYSNYPNPVCKDCDARALNTSGKPARHLSEYPEFQKEYKKYYKKTGVHLMPDDYGDNPVFIDGKKCWRRYRFGGWITMLDIYDCSSIMEFYKKSGFTRRLR